VSRAARSNGGTPAGPRALRSWRAAPVVIFRAGSVATDAVRCGGRVPNTFMVVGPRGGREEAIGIGGAPCVPIRDIDTGSSDHVRDIVNNR
jgi:hypothetical protein